MRIRIAALVASTILLTGGARAAAIGDGGFVNSDRGRRSVALPGCRAPAPPSRVRLPHAAAQYTHPSQPPPNLPPQSATN